MNIASRYRRLALAVAAASFAAVSLNAANQRPQNTSPSVDADDIGGVVTSSKGPEAGVWVIAESTSLPTKFRKIVVTDDAGPLPVAGSAAPGRLQGLGPRLWTGRLAAGDAALGKQVTLQAVIAPTPQAAAQYYPPSSWYSLIKVPDARASSRGTGPEGNGISTAMQTQAHWIHAMKDGCQLCHQMGNKATREIPKELGDLQVAASRPGTGGSKSGSAACR